MKSIKKAWAIEYPNGRLLKLGPSGVASYATKTMAQWSIDNIFKKGKPVKVRITVEKVI